MGYQVSFNLANSNGSENTIERLVSFFGSPFYSITHSPDINATCGLTRDSLLSPSMPRGSRSSLLGESSRKLLSAAYHNEQTGVQFATQVNVSTDPVRPFVNTLSVSFVVDYDRPPFFLAELSAEVESFMEIFGVPCFDRQRQVLEDSIDWGALYKKWLEGFYPHYLIKFKGVSPEDAHEWQQFRHLPQEVCFSDTDIPSSSTDNFLTDSHRPVVVSSELLEAFWSWNYYRYDLVQQFECSSEVPFVAPMIIDDLPRFVCLVKSHDPQLRDYNLLIPDFADGVFISNDVDPLLLKVNQTNTRALEHFGGCYIPAEQLESLDRPDPSLPVLRLTSSDMQIAALSNKSCRWSSIPVHSLYDADMVDELDCMCRESTL